MQEGAGTSARWNWTYFVTSVGSKVCAVHVDACPMQTLDTLQEAPGQGPDLPKDSAGDFTGNCCYGSWMYKSELFSIWTPSSNVSVGLYVLYYYSTCLLSCVYYIKFITVFPLSHFSPSITAKQIQATTDRHVPFPQPPSTSVPDLAAYTSSVGACSSPFCYFLFFRT